MKWLPLFLILLLSTTLVSAFYEEETNAITLSLVSVGIEESVVEATGEAIVIDYVLPNVKSENDILYQMQLVFVVAAKAIPTTPITIIKVRFDAESDPAFIATAPTMAAVYLDQDLITVEEFWGNVLVNDPEIYEEVLDAEKTSGGSMLWLWLILFLIAGIVFRYGVMKKEYQADIAAVKKCFSKK
jgi:hypothetical protein